MVCVGVVFELRRAKTVPGESLSVCGNLPQLSAWRPCDEATAQKLELRTGPRMYPRWSMPRPVWLEVPDRRPGEGGSFAMEYKYVRDRRELSGFAGQGVLWEDAAMPNRVVSLPCEDGSIWIVSDAIWNSAAEPARISRTRGPEVISRWSSLDAEWAALQSPSRGGRPEVEVFELSPRAGLAAPDVREQSEADRAEEDRQAPEGAPDGRPSTYPIEDEFRALSPKDSRAGRRKVPAPLALPALGCPRKAEGGGASAQLLEARARVEQLALENEALRRTVELLVAPSQAPEADEAGKLWPPSSRSLQEPDVEPQVVEEEESDDEELIPEVF